MKPFYVLSLLLVAAWPATAQAPTVTGIIIYVRMWRPNLKGIERVFW